MDKSTNTKPQNVKSVTRKEIDFVPIAKKVWKKLWLVILITVIAGGATYVGGRIFVKPIYRSNFTAYVNNKKEVDSNSLSAQDILASISLANTFEKVIGSKSVLEESAESIGLNYTYSQLSNMVSTSVNNETEIITVNVDTNNPELSYELAEAVRNKSLEYTAEIIEGSSMKIIDHPMVPGGRYSPNYARFGLIGALTGLISTLLFFCIREFFSDKVLDENQVAERYTHLAIVGVIPDVNNADKNSGYHYNYYGHTSDGEDKKSPKYIGEKNRRLH